MPEDMDERKLLKINELRRRRQNTVWPLHCQLCGGRKGHLSEWQMAAPAQGFTLAPN